MPQIFFLCWDTFTSRNDNLTSFAHKDDVLRFAWGFERCWADSNKKTLLSLALFKRFIRYSFMEAHMTTVALIPFLMVLCVEMLEQ